MCWFLPCINMNQPWVHTCPFPLGPSSRFPQHPILLGCRRTWIWVPWVMQHIYSGSLFYKWWCICFHATLAIHPSLSLPHCVKSVPYVCVSTAAAAKSLQSCPTLCNPIDGSRPGSPVPGILQARTLEWVAISFSNAWKWKVKVKALSRVWLLVTPWAAAYQAPPSMGFSREEYWSGVPLPSPVSPLLPCK